MYARGMHITSRIRLRRLVKPRAIFGWVLSAGIALWKLLQLVGAISSGDFMLTASGNSRVVAVWNFLTTPTGTVLLVAVGLIWLAVIVVWPTIKPASDQSKESPSDSVLPSIKEQKEFVEPIATPNIVVYFREDDNYYRVERDQNKVFRESSNSNPIWAVVVEFHNEPNPPRKVIGVTNVIAKIFYYDITHSPNALEHRTDYACWINEASSTVSFNIGTSHYLILGLFTRKVADGNRNFMIYSNDNPSEPCVAQYAGDMRFGITVKLYWGEHYEFGIEEKFELAVWGNAFELFRLAGETDERHNPIKISRGRVDLR